MLRVIFPYGPNFVKRPLHLVGTVFMQDFKERFFVHYFMIKLFKTSLEIKVINN